MAVGEGKYNDNGQRIPMEVKVGDEVLFAKYSGTDIDEGGKHYLLITERDILCVF